MREDGFVTLIAAALALLRRAPSLVTWLTLIAASMGARTLLEQAYAIRNDPPRFVALSATATFGPTLVGGAVLFFLARTLIAPQAGGASPRYARFFGLFVAAALIDRLIVGMWRLSILFGGSPRYMMTYGSALVGSLAVIATFPFLVRALTAAAGSLEPKLPGTVALTFGEERHAYIWYAICAIAFPALGMLTFADLLPSGSINALLGSLLVSAIAATGALLRYLLAVVVAINAVSRSEKSLAETFA